jgi:hypothetical protein
MNTSQLKPSPLPATVEDMLARKTMKGGPSLNDDIDRIHKILWVDDDYRRFLEGVFDEDTVEGSCAADNFEAATMIRNFTKDHAEFNYISKKNKTTIVKSLTTVLRRYHMSRKERAMTVGGEVVPGGNNSVGE